MAREATSPSARLEKLRVSLAKAKKFKRGQTITAEPMATLLGISQVTLRSWADKFDGFEASGCFERGGRGIEWTFKPVATVEWLIKHFEAERARSAKQTQRVRGIVGATDNEEIPTDLSLAELKTLLDLTVRAQDARIKSGELVRASTIKEILRRVFSAIQQAGLRTALELDPTGQWPPETREIVENAIRTVLLKQVQAAEVCLNEFGGSPAQPAEPVA